MLNVASVTLLVGSPLTVTSATTHNVNIRPGPKCERRTCSRTRGRPLQPRTPCRPATGLQGSASRCRPLQPVLSPAHPTAAVAQLPIAMSSLPCRVCPPTMHSNTSHLVERALCGSSAFRRGLRRARLAVDEPAQVEACAACHDRNLSPLRPLPTGHVHVRLLEPC